MRKCLLSLFLLAAPYSGVAQTVNSPWVNHYPFETVESQKDFFKTPALYKTLTTILSQADFKLIDQTYAVDSPIAEIDGWLITSGCMPHECPQGYAKVFVDTHSSNVVVVIRTDDLDDSGFETFATRIFGTIDVTQLPQELAAEVFQQ